MSPLVVDLIKSAALPGIALAVFYYLVGGRSDPFRARLQATGWAVAFMVGSLILFNRLSFPPHDVNESFSWAALLLAGFVWCSPRPVGSRYMVRALFVVALGALILWPIRNSLTTYVHHRNLAAFFFLGLGTWSIIEKASQKVQPLALIALPLIAGTALSFLLVLKGSGSMSQMVSVACALLGAVLLVALVAPNRVSAASILPFVSVFLVAFMVAGHFYLEINPWFMIYLCFPFLLLWIRGAIPFIPREPKAEAITLSVIAILPLAYFLWNMFKISGPLF